MLLKVKISKEQAYGSLLQGIKTLEQKGLKHITFLLTSNPSSTFHFSRYTCALNYYLKLPSVAFS